MSDKLQGFLEHVVNCLVLAFSPRRGEMSIAWVWL